MKKVMMLALAIAPVALWAQSSDFVINGKVNSQAAGAKAYMTYKAAGKNVLDSTAISNGSFRFAGSLVEPVSGQILIDHDGSGLKNINSHSDILTLYIEPGEMKISATDSIKKATIKGSKLNDENSEYNASILPIDKEIADTKNEYASLPPDKKNDTQYTQILVVKYNNALAQKKAAQYQYIAHHSDSYISLMLLEEVAGSSMDVNKTDTIFQSLSPSIRNTFSGKAFSELIASTRAVAIGAIAPEFTQPDTLGNPVSLKDFRGKYVLVDFWASWCGPCRAENPNLVRTFMDYKDKNFTVLSVSLDQPGKRDLWLAAIHSDALAWTQVSDLKFWENSAAKQYGIRAIPANFLLDPSGKIIAKNLRGDALREKLHEVLD